MTAQELYQLLEQAFGEGVILSSDLECRQPWLEIHPAKMKEVSIFLRDDERCWFDFLACVSGVDYGENENRIGVIYHLSSLPKGHNIVLKCFASRIPAENTPVLAPKEPWKGNFPAFRRVNGRELPIFPSVATVWKTAEWHEREAYDLVGIWFEGHPDMRRILLPEDWEGHPLRKDYETAEFYHHIQIDY